VKSIIDSIQVDRYVQSVDEMLLEKGTYERDFDLAWLRAHRWKVVPAKSEYGHLSPKDIDRIVQGLNHGGYVDCLAVATEPLDPLPKCYQVTITAEDFREFSQKCGLLAYMLVNEARSWAISFYSKYKLFAGPPLLIETLLGTTISEARNDFGEFAKSLDVGLAHQPYTEMADRYAEE
jgi:hypothetical protein